MFIFILITDSLTKLLMSSSIIGYILILLKKRKNSRLGLIHTNIGMI